MRRLLVRATATTPWMRWSGAQHDAALCEGVVSALLRLAEETSHRPDSRDCTAYRRGFCGLIALHVLVRESRGDTRLRPAPALLMEKAFSISFETIDRADDDWMLATADQQLKTSYAALLAAGQDLAQQARDECLREFSDLYTRFQECVVAFIGDPAPGRAATLPTRVHSGAPTLSFEGPLRVGYVEGATFPLGELLTAEEVPKIQVVRSPESHDARGTLDLDLSVGAGFQAFAQLREHCQWTSPAVTYAEFDDARAHVPTGLLLSKRHLWCDASFATVLNPGGRSRALEFIALDGDFFRIARQGEEDAERLDRPAMVLCSWASSANYGHWLANSLLSVYLALDKLRSGELALICPPLSERQREQLLAVGAPERAIVETSRSFVRGRIVYPSALSTSTNMCPGSWVSDFFPFLKERLGVAREAAGPRFVYLSRRKLTGSSRVMTNEDALIRRLVNLGFVCADPQELNLAAQARLMSQAEIVVGQFGAALWNLAFVPPGGVAIEIAVDAYASNEYLFLSSLAGLRFIRVMVAVDVAAVEAARGRSFSFEAPIQDILAIMRSLRAGG